MSTDVEESTFKVVDRRREGRDEESQDAEPQSSEPSRPSPQKSSAPTTEPHAARSSEGPQITFAQFFMSLATSASMQLGLIPHPQTGKPETDLQGAGQTIDILAMLEDKTKGNLAGDEANLVAQILADLRLRFIEAKKSSTS